MEKHVAGSLEPVMTKIRWARIHFDESVKVMDEYFENSACYVQEWEDGRKQLVMREPIPITFSLLIGDCLQNLRTALDYLVWELVLSGNGAPGPRNQWPICKTKGAFGKDRGHALHGVPEAAIIEIERLQPYNIARNIEMTQAYVLNELTNINKHRHLLLTAVKGYHSRDPRLASVGYGEPVIGASKLGSTDQPVVVNTENMTVDAYAMGYIEFNEGLLTGKSVSDVLQKLLAWAELEVVPALQPFFGEGAV
jgi:hypothetical protein